MNILVIGAFGTVGRNLVPELVACGHRVSVTSRSQEKPCPWPELNCSRFSLDLLKAETIAVTLENIDLIYYLMHGMSDGEHHTEREVRAAQNLVTASRQSSVSRIIYMGTLVSDNPNSEHMHARVATGQILSASGIPVTELRAGIIVASGSGAFEVMRDAVGHIPLFVAPKTILTQSPPIALKNVIYYLLKLLELPETAGMVLDATGPKWLGYKEMMEILAKSLGKKCRIIVLPGLPVSWVSALLGVVTSVPKPLAKALIAGLGETLQANAQPLQQIIPQSLLSFEEAIAQVLQSEQIKTYPQQWQDGIPEFRNFSPLHAFYAKCASNTITIPAGTQAVWSVVNLLGGRHRYFSLDILWALREWMDVAVGGRGRDHGRDNTEDLIVSERVDSWTILSVKNERRLVLKFGMKAPGGGGMQITLQPITDRSCQMKLSMLWHPAGVWGLAYWYFFAPWHRLLLHGMTKEMSRLAQINQQQIDFSAEQSKKPPIFTNP